MSLDHRIKVLSTYCESANKSLLNKIRKNPLASNVKRLHFISRDQSDFDFFGVLFPFMNNLSNSKLIKKGEINNPYVIDDIIEQKLDLINCYGPSLIKYLFRCSYILV